MTHTFHYRDKQDFIHQLDALLAKLLQKPPLTEYSVIRARYPHLSPSAFTMRLRRFESRHGGYFPKERGRKGRNIIALFVTPALDAYLRK